MYSYRFAVVDYGGDREAILFHDELYSTEEFTRIVNQAKEDAWPTILEAAQRDHDNLVRHALDDIDNPYSYFNLTVSPAELEQHRRETNEWASKPGTVMWNACFDAVYELLTTQYRFRSIEYQAQFVRHAADDEAGQTSPYFREK